MSFIPVIYEQVNVTFSFMTDEIFAHGKEFAFSYTCKDLKEKMLVYNSVNSIRYGEEAFELRDKISM